MIEIEIKLPVNGQAERVGTVTINEVFPDDGTMCVKAHFAFNGDVSRTTMMFVSDEEEDAVVRAIPLLVEWAIAVMEKA